MAASVIADKSQPITVLMLVAEHGGLAGAKVGGMADVIAGIVPALTQIGVAASVVMPGYGFLPQQCMADEPIWFEVPFRQGAERLALYRTHGGEGQTVWLLEHPLWHARPSELYVTSAGDRPFADDADRFALFGAAVAEALLRGIIPEPERLHLHDWHQGFFALLRSQDPRYRPLQSIPMVLSIHNLALQGVRPLGQESSSLAAWYPWLAVPDMARDPRYGHCFNPLRMAIQSADIVHLVSPNYALEVLKPSDASRGFIGGEGLEADLQRLSSEGRLQGILNGCHYHDNGHDGNGHCEAPPLKAVICACVRALARAQGRYGQARSVDLLAQLRLMDWQEALPRKEAGADTSSQPFLLTFVGRLSGQKVDILRRQYRGKPVLAHLLTQLMESAPEGRFILLGSGDVQIAAEFQAMAAAHDNFIFINHFDLTLSEVLYRHGSLFLMPSSFEPCGISQMLAMREGQPCLVSCVGGLVDTVIDGENGWCFGGDSPQAQAAQLLEKFAWLLSHHGGEDWRRIAAAASASRFDWHTAARDYLSRLYCR